MDELTSVRQSDLAIQSGVTIMSRSRITCLAATLALLILAPAAVGHTTQGNATPANAGAHPWWSDGCTGVPDKGNTFDFYHACVHHDACYKGFPNSKRKGALGSYWVSRSQCDTWFVNDMHASCNWKFGDPSTTLRGRKCSQRARDYHYGVRQAPGTSNLARNAYKGPVND